MSEEIDPLDLGCKKVGNDYLLVYGEKNILCERGIYKVAHHSVFLLNLLRQDLVRHGALKLTEKNSLKLLDGEESEIDGNQISTFYLMFSDQKHVIETGELFPQFPLDLLFDKCLFSTCNGPPLETEQNRLLGAIWSVLNEKVGEDAVCDLRDYAIAWYYYNSGFIEVDVEEGITYEDLSKSEWRKIREDWLESGPGDLISPSDFVKKDFAIYFRKIFDELTSEEKTGLYYLCNLSGYTTTLVPLALIKGWFTVSQFSNTLTGVGGFILDRYGSSSESSLKEHRRMFDVCESTGNQILTYIVESKKGLPENIEGSNAHTVKQLIKAGESKKIEFKSTFRFCLKKKSHQHFVSDSIVKSVCAFLNTDLGGTLLVGVSDDGKILGLDNDNFKNDDDCQLFFKNKVTSNLGADIIPFVELEITNLKGKSIAVIKIKKATTPIYFKNVFYVRNGPSSDPLDLPDAVNYIREHFD